MSAPVDTSHLIFLGLHGRVVALNKHNGQTAWAIPLAGVFGDDFVTVQADDTQVYAYCRGKLHCLDRLTGHVLWTNDLKGLGYGFACICVPGFGTVPDASALARMAEASRESASSDALLMSQGS